MEQSLPGEANRFAEEIPEGSLPHSQVPKTCRYPESDRSSPPTHFLKIYLNIILPSKPGSLKWSLSLRFPHQDPIHPLSSPIRATCPAHLILLDIITRTLLGEEYRSLSSSLCSFLHPPVTSSLWPKYSPQHPIFKNPQPTLLPQCERPSFTPI